MTDEFELSFKEVPLCTAHAIDMIASDLSNACELLKKQQYLDAHVSIDGARRKMIELEKIESLFRGQQ